MKKLLIILVGLLFLTGCNTSMESRPQEKVEEWLAQYMQQDEGVVEELREWLMDENLDDEERGTYQSILEKQYQNLSYKILEEEIEGNKAEVEVEIEVLDYKTSMNASRDYYENHRDEFTEEVSPDMPIEEIKEFIDYKLDQLKKVEDKAKYTLEFHLKREEDEWRITKIDDDAFLKIYGLY